MKQKSKYLTKRQIIEATGILPYKLDYLTESKQIEAIRRGKGKDRLYAPNTIDRIKNLLED